MDKPKDSTTPRRNHRYYTYVEPVMSDPIIRGYFTLIASFLLVAFFIFFALSPTFSTIVGLVRKIDDQKAVLTSLESKINNLIAAQENYSQIEPDLPLLQAALPEKPLPEDVFQSVVTQATESGVSVLSFQFGQVYLSGINPKLKQTTPQAENTGSSNSVQNSQAVNIASLGVPIIKFSLSVSGKKEEIINFAKAIEAFPRVISLSSISIGSETQQSTTDVTFAEISGVAFYFPKLQTKSQ